MTVTETNTPPARTPRQQLMALEYRTSRAASRLDTACDQLRCLEAELETFLEDYYVRVGPYVEELHALEETLAQFKSSGSEEVQPSFMEQLFTDTHHHVMRRKNVQELEQELKSLYRSMAKTYHPDRATGSQVVERLKQDVIRTINDAYARRNLGELYKLKFDMEIRRKGHAMNAEDKITLYEQRYEAITRALEDVDCRRERIMVTPAYALMQRALEMRLAGKDLVTLIIRELKQQIHSKQRRIVTTKIRTLYLEAPTPLSAPA